MSLVYGLFPPVLEFAHPSLQVVVQTEVHLSLQVFVQSVLQVAEQLESQPL